MIKHPFVVFIVVISFLVTGLFALIQSPSFAKVFKSVAARHLPKNLGIDGDFSEFSIKLFPPGFSIKNPRVTLKAGNIVNLPAGSSVFVERIDFNFRPFQIFSGDIRVHEVILVNGDVELIVDPSSFIKKNKVKPARFGFHWDELLQIKAEAVALQDIHLNVKSAEPGVPRQLLSALAKNLRFSQWEGKGGLGYSIALNLSQVRSDYVKNLPIPDTLDELNCNAHINPLGVQVESLLVSGRGFELSVAGRVRGNVLNPKELILDSSIKVRGEIEKFIKLYSLKKEPHDKPSGSFAFLGKLQGNLEKISETLHANGQFVIKNFSFQKWKADLVNLDVQWKASPTGGEFFLEKGLISSVETPRVGGNHAGSGGKILLDPVKWTVGSAAPLEIALRFERAHVHWLGAMALKQVYPLDFRLSGAFNVSLKPPVKGQKWEIRANADATVENFQLDNQRYQKIKPLNRLIKIPKIKLNGLLVVNAHELRPINFFLSLPHSKISLGGKIDFKTGYDLEGHGQINLEDFGQIAENDIRGIGGIVAHIHGPASAVLVDLDLNVEDAYYLKLYLGDLKGRITWDDGIDQLTFNDAQLKKNMTRYSVNGFLDFTGENKANLVAHFSKGNINDIIEIFKNRTDSLSWFPHNLQGQVTGALKVTGGISLNKIKILSNLDGVNWEYLGERFKKVHLEGGFDQGKYLLSEFIAIKRTGEITGHIFFDVDENFDWDFKSQDLLVNDLDRIAQLDVPMRGKIKFETRGKGKQGSLTSLTYLNLTEYTVRGLSMPPSQLTLRTDRGVINVQSSIMGGQGFLDAVYNFNPHELSYIHGELKAFDFSPLLLLLNPKSIHDRDLVGTLSARVDLTFNSGEIEKSSGTVSVSEYLLARSGIKFELVHPLFMTLNQGSFEVKDVRVRGRQGEMELSLKTKGSQIEGLISGELDIGVAQFFTGSIVQASGVANLDFSIGGTLKEPTLFGKATLENASLRLSSVDSPFANMTGTFQLRQNIMSIQNVQADLGGGRVSAQGRITFYPDRFPGISLKADLRGSKIKAYPFQYVQVSGTLGINGEKTPYLIDGLISVDSALSKEKVLNGKREGADFKVLQYAPPISSEGERAGSPFQLNVKVEADRGVMIQNDLFKDTQVKGDLTLVNTLDAPRVLGRVEVIRGKILFKDRVFQIQNATADFDSPTVINPSFDLNANTDVNGVKIQMYASGRIDKVKDIKIEFTSHPAMQESEILSLLTVGLTSSDAKKLSSADLSTVQQGEAASLVLHSLDFNRDLEDKTGFQVQLDDSLNPRQGISALSSQSQADTQVAPQIIIKRKLGDRVSLSAGSTVGLGTSKSNQFNLDFSVNDHLSVNGVIYNYTMSGTADAQATQSTSGYSMGLDLKFQKRFK